MLVRKGFAVAVAVSSVAVGMGIGAATSKSGEAIAARRPVTSAESPAVAGPLIDVSEPPAVDGEVEAPAPSAAPGAPPAAPTAGVVPIGNVKTPHGFVVPALATVAGGYSIVTPCGSRGDIPGTPMPSVDVVLDPGHGGSETGAIGPNGLQEKDLNLSVAARAAESLRKSGVSVLLTRTADTRTSLATRALLAKGAKAKAFVSVHHNAGAVATSPEPGTEAFAQVDDPAAATLASLINAEVRKVLTPLGATWTANAETGVKARRGSKGNDYYGVLRRTRGVPGVISEALFIDEPTQADLLARVDVQQAEGEAIARAVRRFLATKPQSQPQTPVEPPTTTPGCVDPQL